MNALDTTHSLVRTLCTREQPRPATCSTPEDLTVRRLNAYTRGETAVAHVGSKAANSRMGIAKEYSCSRTCTSGQRCSPCVRLQEAARPRGSDVIYFSGSAQAPIFARFLALNISSQYCVVASRAFLHSAVDCMRGRSTVGACAGVRVLSVIRMHGARCVSHVAMRRVLRTRK